MNVCLGFYIELPIIQFLTNKFSI